MSESKKSRKRSFSSLWLQDERFSAWIREVPDNKYLFYCIICDKQISCGLSHILRHADTAIHKNKYRKISSSSENNDKSPKKKKIAREYKFQPDWLEIDLFKPWLREVVTHNDCSFFCTFCEKSYVGGLSHIYRHAESKGHIENSTINRYELNKDVDMAEESLSFQEKRKSAENRFAALIADTNIPFKTAKDILHLFQTIGKDYNVLKKMCISRTKCSKIISNVLCPVETNYVVTTIQNTKFSIFIDETSDISNKKWMTFAVRSKNFRYLFSTS